MEAEDQPQEEKPSGLDRKIIIARDGVELGSFTYWDALPMKDSGELRPNDYVYRKSGKGGKWVHLHHVLREDFFADHDWSEYDVLLEEELDKAKERLNGYKEMLKTSNDRNEKKEAEYRIQEYTELIEYLKGMKQREIKRRKESEEEEATYNKKEKERLDQTLEALDAFIAAAKKEDDFLEFFDQHSTDYLMFTDDNLYEIKKKIWDALRRLRITEEDKTELCKKMIGEEEKSDFWTPLDNCKNVLTDFLQERGLLSLTAEEINKSNADKEVLRKSLEPEKYTCTKCGRVTTAPESCSNTCTERTPHKWDKPTFTERIESGDLPEGWSVSID
ncbi:MAG: hypothetical protein EBT07_12940 [Actinobacteria bacterium]|nr:hypothetical protein [Actinomycetota bacterium]